MAAGTLQPRHTCSVTAFAPQMGSGCQWFWAPRRAYSCSPWRCRGVYAGRQAAPKEPPAHHLRQHSTAAAAAAPTRPQSHTHLQLLAGLLGGQVEARGQLLKGWKLGRNPARYTEGQPYQRMSGLLGSLVGASRARFRARLQGLGFISKQNLVGNYS